MLPNIFNTASSQTISDYDPISTPYHGLDLDSSGLSCSTATSLDVVNHSLGICQLKIASQQPLVATKNTGAS
jgi:hypothetical protein